MRFTHPSHLCLSWDSIDTLEQFVDNLQNILDRLPNPEWVESTSQVNQYILKRDISNIALHLYRKFDQNLEAVPDEPASFDLEYVLQVKNWSVRCLQHIKQGAEIERSSQQTESGEKLIKPQKSTGKGEARGSTDPKCISALIEHHQYENGSILHLEPAGVHELARKANVSAATASRFFDRHWAGKHKNDSSEKPSGHLLYQQMVRRDKQQLIHSLKMLNGEIGPHVFAGLAKPELLEDDK